MIDLHPSVDFCVKLARLYWWDVIWAVEHQIFGWKDIKDYANTCVEACRPEMLGIVCSILSLEKNDASEIVDLARDAAVKERKSPVGDESDKWLFLLLAWVYCNRGIFDDPLSIAEELYADFNYPESMEAFIGYLPAKDGWDSVAHSKAENEARMMNSFREFIEGSGFRKPQ